MINGRPRGKFKGYKGIRQGDPLSPFLFTLVADGLSRLSTFASEKRMIRGCKVGKDKVEISHLQFADDILFFLEADEFVFDNLLKVLRIFCEVSGLKVNMGKSV